MHPHLGGPLAGPHFALRHRRRPQHVARCRQQLSVQRRDRLRRGHSMQQEAPSKPPHVCSVPTLSLSLTLTLTLPLTLTLTLTLTL